MASANKIEVNVPPSTAKCRFVQNKFAQVKQFTFLKNICLTEEMSSSERDDGDCPDGKKVIQE